MAHLDYFLIGAAGAFILEAMVWPEYQAKLTPSRFKKMIRSFEYWLVVAALIFASGLFAWLMNYDEEVGPSTILIYGIAARSTVRQLGRGYAPKLHFGPKDRSLFLDVINPGK